MAQISPAYFWNYIIVKLFGKGTYPFADVFRRMKE